MSARHSWAQGARHKTCVNKGCPWMQRPKQRTTVGKEGPAKVAVEFSNDGGKHWAVMSPFPPCEGER